MKRRFRLTRSTDFERVRRVGKSYAHPFIVLVATPNEDGRLRIGVAAGRSLGNAVLRNRVKRRLRAAASSFFPQLRPGWDIVLLARRPMNTATFVEVYAALSGLLRRAQLLKDLHDI